MITLLHNISRLQMDNDISQRLLLNPYHHMFPKRKIIIISCNTYFNVISWHLQDVCLNSRQHYLDLTVDNDR